MNELINNLLIDEDLGKNRFLSYEEEQEIFTLLKETPSLSEKVQTIMLKANMQLVHKIAREYHPASTITYEDIVQLGMMGLSQAVNKFDLSRGVKFITYATYWIKKSIASGVEKAINIYDQPQSFNDLKKKYYETEEKLVAEKKRSVTLDEIAESMDATIEELAILFQLSKTESLDKEIDEDGNVILADKIESSSILPSEVLATEEKNQTMIDAVNNLSPREKQVILYMFGFDDGEKHTYSDIGEKFGFTRQRAQVIAKGAIKKMQEYIKLIDEE